VLQDAPYLVANPAMVLQDEKMTKSSPYFLKPPSQQFKDGAELSYYSRDPQLSFASEKPRFYYGHYAGVIKESQSDSS
jgi:hypothetical protein